MNNIDMEKLNKAIDIIEEKSVYRVQARCDDGSVVVTSINGMPTTHWTAKRVFELAEIMKKKPF